VLEFVAFITAMLVFATLMAFSSMPHDINSIDEVRPTAIRYDNSYNVGNV